MASRYITFNARTVFLAFFTRSQSGSCTPCKAGRPPMESEGPVATGGTSEQSQGWEVCVVRSLGGRMSSSLKGITSVSKL